MGRQATVSAKNRNASPPKPDGDSGDTIVFAWFSASPPCHHVTTWQRGMPAEASDKRAATQPPEKSETAHNSPWAVFLMFLRLGRTSFGGPISHLGYFRSEFVERRKWCDEKTYGDLIALCQFLPGPASSQVGIAIGMIRAGYAGALAAWIGFTMPSAFALVL